jgi:hypothetical protein
MAESEGQPTDVDVDGFVVVRGGWAMRDKTIETAWKEAIG